MNGLYFDPDTHTYRYDGVVIPSVTQVLRPLSNFGVVAPDVLSAAMAFGTAAHMACELHDTGMLDYSTLDPALAPYLQAWQRFCADHAVEWELIEERVYSGTHKYAGTLDRYGKVAGKACVIDIKTGSVLYPSTGPQLAAYKNAIPGAPPMTTRMAVQLKSDGNYIAKTYTDRDDWPAFLSLLTLKQWCSRHSINPFKE
jgi:hypothetical protein